MLPSSTRPLPRVIIQVGMVICVICVEVALLMHVLFWFGDLHWRLRDNTAVLPFFLFGACLIFLPLPFLRRRAVPRSPEGLLR